MSKIIGVSGAQGAGKTTMLAALQRAGIEVDQFKVSRSVQAELGWTSLEQVMQSPQVMMDFQQKVLTRKLENDATIRMSTEPDFILVERTFADIFAYTKLWTNRFVNDGRLGINEAIDYLNDYEQKCVQAQTIYSGSALLPMMEHMVFEHDPNRAAQADVTTVWNDIVHFHFELLPPTYRYTTITEKSVEDRAFQVLKFLRTL